MSDFDNYPYTEFHELNLDPTLKTLKEDKTELEKAETKFNGVGDTIDSDNKKLDDAKAKADGINQSADNLVNETNAKTDTINQKADTVNNRKKENNDKIEEVNQKQEETSTQADNSVSNAYYENELTPEELATSKKLGTLRVAKASATTSNEIRTTTPTGVLGNCVVWSSSPFTFINTNPQILTNQDYSKENIIIQYQCAGSFFAFSTFDKVKGDFVLGSNGHILGNEYFTSNILVTNRHLDFHTHYYSNQNPPSSTDKFTMILPKTDSHTWNGGYEQFTDISANSVITTKENLLSNHVYVYYVIKDRKRRMHGYIYNGVLTETFGTKYIGDVLSVEFSDNTFQLKQGEESSTSSEYRLYFVDLGEM